MQFSMLRTRGNPYTMTTNKQKEKEDMLKQHHTNEPRKEKEYTIKHPPRHPMLSLHFRRSSAVQLAAHWGRTRRK